MAAVERSQTHAYIHCIYSPSFTFDSHLQVVDVHREVYMCLCAAAAALSHSQFLGLKPLNLSGSDTSKGKKILGPI